MATLSHLPRWSIEVVRTVIILAIVLAVGTVYQARGDDHDVTYHACLFAGSLSQVSTNPPANCGRGAPISWVSGGQPGLSQVYDSTGTNSGPLVYGFAGAPVTVLRTLNVPAGSYVVTATMELGHGSRTADQIAHCRIVGETVSAQARPTLDQAEIGFPVYVVVPMQAVVTVSEPGTIELSCFTPAGSGDTLGASSEVSPFWSSLIAIPVEQVN